MKRLRRLGRPILIANQILALAAAGLLTWIAVVNVLT